MKVKILGLDELTEEELESCIDENNFLMIDKVSRIIHKKHLESGKTNIKDFNQWDAEMRSWSRPSRRG